MPTYYCPDCGNRLIQIYDPYQNYDMETGKRKTTYTCQTPRCPYACRLRGHDYSFWDSCRRCGKVAIGNF